MSVRRTLALAAVFATAAATPALAASHPKPHPRPAPSLRPSTPLVVTDKAGDANGINSESHAVPADPSQTGPAQMASADILSFSLGRLDNKKTVLGLTASMTMSAPPAAGAIYRIQAATATCTTFWIAYAFPAGPDSPSASLRENCGGATSTTTTKIDAAISGNTITWSLPFSILPKDIKVGTVISNAFGETKGHIGTSPLASLPAAGTSGPTAPTIDDTATAPSGYTVGS